MGRRVFFSFHYEKDIWRANVVRNSWVTQDAAGFWDASLWEETKKKGDAAIKRMIDEGLQNTSVTAILIGAETYSRQWVKYEIEESVKRGNGILGIHISAIKDQKGYSSNRGLNPMDSIIATVNGRKGLLSQFYRTYDWFEDSGYTNLGTWVENAARIARR